MLLNMSCNASDASGNPEVPSSRGVEFSHAADTISTSVIRANGIKIDCGVPRWSVAEYKMRYADMFDTRRFGAMFMVGSDSLMVDRRNIRQDMDMKTWNRK